jgi:hypothetical protein
MTDSSLSESTREALKSYASRTDEPFSASRSAALLESARAAAERAPSQVVLKVAVFGLACAAGAACFVTFVPRTGAQSAAPEVEASAGARYRWEGQTLHVQAGRVRVDARGGRGVPVETSEVAALVENAAAVFEVTAGATTLLAEESEVTWRTKSGSGAVAPHRKVSFDAAIELTAVARGPRLESCLGGTGGGGYENCVAAAAEGSGLAAQTALFELGMAARDRGDFEEAARQFRAYGARFPAGMFAPEASISLMHELKKAGRGAEASAEARDFPLRFPDEPRTEQVRRWAEQLP